MSAINSNFNSLNSALWQNFSTGKKDAGQAGATDLSSLLNAGQTGVNDLVNLFNSGQTGISDIAGLLNAKQTGQTQIQGVSDFQTMLESLSDPSKAGEFTSRTIQGHAEYNLKAAFQLENGQKLNLEMQITIDIKIKQTKTAYTKQNEQQSDYFSPENTAKRIGDFAMGFMGAFQSNHTDQSASDVTTGFFDLAKKAISKGFDDAKSLLGAFYGDKADKTYDLVMNYLDNAKSNLLGTGEKTAETK